MSLFGPSMTEASGAAVFGLGAVGGGGGGGGGNLCSATTSTLSAESDACEPAGIGRVPRFTVIECGSADAGLGLVESLHTVANLSADQIDAVCGSKYWQYARQCWRL